MKALSASIGLILEVIRIILIFGLIGALISTVVSEIYIEFSVNLTHTGWSCYFGILVLIFVMYRNKIQFSGWYNGKGREKLTKIVTKLLISCSIIMILIPGINELIHRF
ncbi:hypothetical protein [Gottfriedia acidiceleris]|uniref:Uncharacterized protein n=1 Tax=Gottfriedia acidiceleris TaxID=371036 RepID=A0ABY4JS01_9BACI|nr:hypothetical protein [Gottfriedia acidiceleris]UPM56257.1 hypothetical protein MY490_10650 [Gottfriedia acidiceleris]